MPKSKKVEAAEEDKGPGFVLDYAEDTGFFIHQLDTCKRAEALARLLKRTFSGSDRPVPTTSKEGGLEAYTFYNSLEKIQEKIPDLKIYQFDRLIPSLNKALDELNLRHAATPDSDQQDALFKKYEKFFVSITPEVEVIKKAA